MNGEELSESHWKAVKFHLDRRIIPNKCTIVCVGSNVSRQSLLKLVGLSSSNISKSFLFVCECLSAPELCAAMCELCASGTFSTPLFDAFQTSLCGPERHVMKIPVSENRKCS